MADPKQKTPEKKPKEVSDAKNQPKRGKSKQKPLPLLIETAFTVAKITVIGLGIVVFLVSVTSGNTLVTAALHTIVAMVVTGIIAWLIVWMLIRGSMDSLIAEIKSAKDAEPKSTKDYTA